ncbi:hypothetical protein [Denitrobaculum tricleocarpae]|uniref:Uncharacterized protein n=1 Tax=Denitrobaculum tricleocarpae TaxID=2591009 RepID=A0A545TF28_9PROT|nr:hypothetical protein [Denitrobaculum tricleocarpae]TQV75837.1 hypothetical protein FKG95_23285 [Denitrobaculum tricleocarpae]
MQVKFHTKHVFLGWEYAWMAVDEVGAVGYFSTAGFGPIPETCTRNENMFDEAFEEIVREEKRCEYEQFSGFDASISTWGDVARRGIFSFDWESQTSRFMLVCKPLNPIRLENMRGRLYQETKEIRLPCRFAERTGMREVINFC